jgi:hypothetical protein
MSNKFFVAVTAHNPLERFDVLLETLRAYNKIPGHKDFYIFIDFEHKQDKDIVFDLLEPNLGACGLNIVVAEPEYTGFSLTWAHKPLLIQAVQAKTHDFYVYTENDMLFTHKHFDYWVSWKDKLKELNLEPGFCRFERFNERSIPFDNYRRWELNGLTKSVWGERPYKAQTFITPCDDFVCFVSLGNPYMGMMILDQDMADEYIVSNSCDPIKSFNLTKFRCWPIADRSSMGLAFEKLAFEQEHRRVVPLTKERGKIRIAPCGLLEHLDTKYSKVLSTENLSLLDITQMFSV